MDAIVELQQIKTYLGGNWLHDGIDLKIQRGEVLAIVGGSGTGKTTLMREILLLHRQTSGRIKLFNQDVTDFTDAQIMRIRRRMGVMFQHGALFSSLSVLENVAFPLQEFTHLTSSRIQELAKLKIALVGFPMDSIHKSPAELSGGMLKRAAIARAIAMDPELLFLDEPTAGLDPQGASGLDELVVSLKVNLGLTIVMVTHDLDTLYRVADRIAFLGEGGLLGVGPMSDLAKIEHPIIQDYFSGPRATRVAG